jgi:hypothetical protein
MMRHIAVRLAAAGVIMVGAAVAAHAQTRPAARPRPRPSRVPIGYLSLNGGGQLARTDFQTTVTFPLYTEEADFDAGYNAPSAIGIDVGGGFRVWRQLTAGVAVTYFQDKAHATFDARLPHPLLPRRQRPLDGSISSLQRAETAMHVQVAWLAPVDDRIIVAVFGGPTVFRVEQDIVTRLVLDETYPFDDVALQRAAIESQKENAVGFHAGADVFYRLARQFGVGGVARYSRGTLSVATRTDQDADLTTGGLHLSGGIRWVF